MRKLILASAIVLLSTSAFAGGSRGLSSSQPREPQITQIAQPQVAPSQAPVRKAEVTVLPGPAEQPAVTAPPPSMEEKLKAAGEIKPDGNPAVPAPVQVRAPVQAQPAPTPVHATAPAAAKPVAQAHSHKPANKRVAHRGEGNERKARRIAARFGIYW